MPDLGGKYGYTHPPLKEGGHLCETRTTPLKRREIGVKRILVICMSKPLYRNYACAINCQTKSQKMQTKQKRTITIFHEKSRSNANYAKKS